MTSQYREIVTGMVASVVFGSLVLLAHVSIIPALIVAGLIYFGGRLVIPLKLLGSNGQPLLAPPRESDERIIARGFEQAATFGELASQVGDETLRRRVTHISERLTAIFRELEKQPRSMAEVRLFVGTYLPSAIGIVRSYLRLIAHPDLDATNVRTAQAERSINRIADALKKLHQQIFEEEIDEFNGATEVLADILADGQPLQGEEENP